MKSTIFVVLLVAASALNAFAQTSSPQTIPAKYEGGMFGFSKKESGSLKFDDMNNRLVFLGRDGKEKFSLPYSSINVVEPTSKSVRSVGGTTAGVIAGTVVPGGGLLGLIRERRRYVTLQFDDPDVVARGSVSFKVGGTAEIASTVQRIGQKAGLTQRGEAYYRARPANPGI
jgi:hypothetical protein